MGLGQHADYENAGLDVGATAGAQEHGIELLEFLDRAVGQDLAGALGVPAAADDRAANYLLPKSIMASTMMDMSTNVLGAIVQLRRALARAFAVTFTGDISGRQSVLLREIGTCGQVSQVALARATASDPSAVVRLLDELEARELVERRRSETDRREMMVSLTSHGRKALRPLDVLHKRLADAAAEALTVEERRVFVTLAEKIQSCLTTLVEGDAALSKGADGKR
jgi:DNA-binding MarR family transcriptional regulator